MTRQISDEDLLQLRETHARCPRLEMTSSCETETYESTSAKRVEYFVGPYDDACDVVAWIGSSYEENERSDLADVFALLFNKLPEILARLDAAESRASELQRKVERMQSVACKECGGKGSVDSGGFTEWGSPIEIPCQFCQE